MGEAIIGQLRDWNASASIIDGFRSQLDNIKSIQGIREVMNKLSEMFAAATNTQGAYQAVQVLFSKVYKITGQDMSRELNDEEKHLLQSTIMDALKAIKAQDSLMSGVEQALRSAKKPSDVIGVLNYLKSMFKPGDEVNNDNENIIPDLSKYAQFYEYQKKNGLKIM